MLYKDLKKIPALVLLLCIMYSAGVSLTCEPSGIL